MDTTTRPTVALTLAPESAYRVHFLALASAARASIAYSRRLVKISTPAYAEHVQSLPCGAQDGEGDRTEALRNSAEFSWQLADAVGASIAAAYPSAGSDGWGSSLRDVTQEARSFAGFLYSRNAIDAAAMYRYSDSLTERLDAACSTYQI